MVILGDCATVKKKKKKGRQKIEIKKIEKPSNRLVTFSKRRSGLFKKAGELFLLTGAQVAIVVHSHSNRVFSFCHPVVDRFLGGDAAEIEAPPMMRDYNRRYSDVCKEIDAEKRKAEGIEVAQIVETHLTDGGGGGFWWGDDVDGKRSVEEMEEYVAALESLGKAVALKANEIVHSRSLLPVVYNPPPPAPAVDDHASDRTIKWWF